MQLIKKKQRGKKLYTTMNVVRVENSLCSPSILPLIKVYEKLNLINFFTTPPSSFSSLFNVYTEMNFYCSFASMLFTFEMKFYDVWMNIEHKWRASRWSKIVGLWAISYWKKLTFLCEFRSDRIPTKKKKWWKIG